MILKKTFLILRRKKKERAITICYFILEKVYGIMICFLIVNSIFFEHIV